MVVDAGVRGGAVKEDGVGVVNADGVGWGLLRAKIRRERGC
jgi:hypothetical protein